VQSAGAGAAGGVAGRAAAPGVRDPAVFPRALAFREAVALPDVLPAEFAAGAGAFWCTATGEPVRALRTLRTMSRTTPGSWPYVAVTDSPACRAACAPPCPPASALCRCTEGAAAGGATLTVSVWPIS
jgi:hypothetical protein